MGTPDVAKDLFKEGQKIIKEVVWAIPLLSRRNIAQLGFTRIITFMMGSLQFYFFEKMNDDGVRVKEVPLNSQFEASSLGF